MEICPLCKEQIHPLQENYVVVRDGQGKDWNAHPKCTVGLELLQDLADRATADLVASTLGLTLFGKEVLKKFIGEKPCFFCKKSTPSTIRGTDGTVYPYCGCRKLM